MSSPNHAYVRVTIVLNNLLLPCHKHSHSRPYGPTTEQRLLILGSSRPLEEVHDDGPGSAHLMNLPSPAGWTGFCYSPTRKCCGAC
jgi:hypothetical protein